MKKIVAVVVLIVIMAAGWFAYRDHQVSELAGAIGPHVKGVSLRTSAVAESHISPSNMSWKEAFSKADDAIRAADDAALAVQTLDGSIKPELVAAGTDIIKASQTLARSLNKANRSHFEMSNAIDAFREAVEGLKGTTSYSFELASKSAARARERSDKAVVEFEKSTDEAREAITSYKANRVKAAQVLKENLLISNETLEALEKYFAKESKS